MRGYNNGWKSFKKPSVEMISCSSNFFWRQWEQTDEFPEILFPQATAEEI